MSRNRRAESSFPGGLPLPLCSERQGAKQTRETNTRGVQGCEARRAPGRRKASGPRRDAHAAEPHGGMSASDEADGLRPRYGCKFLTTRLLSWPGLELPAGGPFVLPCPSPTRGRGSTRRPAARATRRWMSPSASFLMCRRDSALLASYTESHFRVFYSLQGSTRPDPTRPGPVKGQNFYSFATCCFPSILIR